MAIADFLKNVFNANLDALTLDDFVNGEPNKKVKSRLGREYFTLATIESKISELSTAIQTALAAGAGQGGWIDSLIQTEGGRTQREKNQDVVSAKDFGVKADGVTDDTVNLQRAIDYAGSTGKSLFLPAGIYSPTSTLNIKNPTRIFGVGHSDKNTDGTPSNKGTQLYFNHNIIGFLGYAEGHQPSGHLIGNMSIRRNQPEPTDNWSPTPCEYDIDLVNYASVTIRDVYFMCSTKAILVRSGGGRINMYNIDGHVFQKGIVVEESYDVIRIDQVHFWAFWRDDANVHKYTMNNFDAIHLYRTDNPMISNVFTIFARAGLRCSRGSAGGVSKIHLSNADFDRGNYGIWLDSSTIGVTGHFENVTHQCEDTSVSGIGLFVQGKNNDIQIGNFYTTNNSSNGIRAEGINNRVQIGSVKVGAFDLVKRNFPAIEATDSNIIMLGNYPSLGEGKPFSDTGLISAPKSISRKANIAAGTGTIDTYSADILYRLLGDTITISYSINIIDNGTGGGDIRLELPFQSNGAIAYTGSGRNMTTGKGLLGIIPTDAPKFLVIYNTDNGYPAGSNNQLNGTISYNINGI